MKTCELHVHDNRTASCLVFHGMSEVADQVCGEIQTAHVVYNIFLSENRVVNDVITKILHNQTGARWSDTIRRKKFRFAFRVIAAKIREVDLFCTDRLRSDETFLLRRA
jgi:hypothetical protein